MNDRYTQEAMRFTASVMGNPEYLDAIKRVKQAPDERARGLEKLNSFHAHNHAEQEKRAQEKAQNVGD